MIRVLSMLLNDVSDRGVGFDGVPVEECSGYFGFAGLISVGHDSEPRVQVIGDVDVDASAGCHRPAPVMTYSYSGQK